MKLIDLRAKINASPTTAAGKRKFSKALRKEIIAHIQQSSQPLGVICRKLEISVSTAHYWLRKNPAPKQRATSEFQSISVACEEAAPVAKSNPIDTKLTLSGPSGFQLSGSTSAILEVWRHIHASNSQ